MKYLKTWISLKRLSSVVKLFHHENGPVGVRGWAQLQGHPCFQHKSRVMCSSGQELLALQFVRNLSRAGESWGTYVGLFVLVEVTGAQRSEMPWEGPWPPEGCTRRLKKDGANPVNRTGWACLPQEALNCKGLQANHRGRPAGFQAAKPWTFNSEFSSVKWWKGISLGLPLRR